MRGLDESDLIDQAVLGFTFGVRRRGAGSAALAAVRKRMALIGGARIVVLVPGNRANDVGVEHDKGVAARLNIDAVFPQDIAVVTQALVAALSAHDFLRSHIELFVRFQLALDGKKGGLVSILLNAIWGEGLTEVVDVVFLKSRCGGSKNAFGA